MNIVIINGSPRKNGNTYQAVKIVKSNLLQLDPNTTFTEYFLPQDMPEFCRGCFNCFAHGEENCPHAKFVQPILNNMLAADGIVFTTPVYAMSCSGAVKALLDHLAYTFVVHRARPEMVGKNVFILATTAGAGTNSAIKPIKESLSFWGTAKPLVCGIAVRAKELDEMPKKRRDSVYRILKKKSNLFYNRMDKKRKPSLLFRTFFYTICTQRIQFFTPLEKDLSYWKAQGWTADKRPW